MAEASNALFSHFFVRFQPSATPSKSVSLSLDPFPASPWGLSEYPVLRSHSSCLFLHLQPHYHPSRESPYLSHIYGLIFSNQFSSSFLLSSYLFGIPRILLPVGLASDVSYPDVAFTSWQFNLLSTAFSKPDRFHSNFYNFF